MAFVRGAVWGLVVGGIGAAGASLVAPQPVRTAMSTPAPVTEPVVAPVAEPVSEPVTAPVAEPAPEPVASVSAPAAPDLPAQSAAAVPTAQEAAAPQPASEPVMAAPAEDTAAPVADSLPAATPETADVAGTMTAPQTSPKADVTAAAESPVLPNPQSLAPETPVAEQDVIVATAPTAPVVVEVPEAEVEVIVLPDAPEVVETPEVGSAAPEPVRPAQEALPATEQAATAPAPGLPQITPDTAEAPEPAKKIVLPQVDKTEDAAPVVVSIIKDAPRGLPGSGRSEIVKRTPDPAPEAAPEVPEETGDATTGALTRYAAFFDNPEDMPLMSVLLIDDGSLSGGQAAVSEIPFPVTILLDPAQAGATERMDRWRQAGFEVASLAALPAGATPSDVAVALEASFELLPQAVALVDIAADGTPVAANDASQVIETLAQSGRGLVLPQDGLNTALRRATARDVPAGTIYRDLDDEGQDARVIRRFVDQAAFRARQEPGVILLGRVRPETISALVLWGTANRAAQVALAPLSATLLANAANQRLTR